MRAGRNLGALVAALLVGVTVGQAGFSPGANDYTVESAESGPLSQEVAFRGIATPWEDLPVANMVVGVLSNAGNVVERQAVRTTWAQLQSLTDPKLNRLTLEQKQALVVRFVVGDTSDPERAAELEKEQAKYHDIVRVPVGEGVETSMKKTGEFMKWAHLTFNYDWVFMTRDDAFVRIDKVLQALTSEGKEKVYMGKMVTDRTVNRQLDSRTPFPIYPAYADGSGYGVSHDLVDFIVNNLEDLNYPVIRGGDIAVGNWFSGTNVEPTDYKGFHNKHEGSDKDMLVQANVDPETMKRTFINLVKGVPCHDRPFYPAQDSSSSSSMSLLLSIDEGKGGELKDEALMGVSDGAEEGGMGGGEEGEEKEDDEEGGEAVADFKAQMDGNADGAAFAAKMNAGMGARGAVTLDDAAVKVVERYPMRN